jgi:hypothetical protein
MYFLITFMNVGVASGPGFPLQVLALPSRKASHAPGFSLQSLTLAGALSLGKLKRIGLIKKNFELFSNIIQQIIKRKFGLIPKIPFSLITHINPIYTFWERPAF